jgi:hypothetical protein
LPKDYKPTFFYRYTSSIHDKREKVYSCSNCGHPLSLFQVDCYDGSEAYQRRHAEILKEEEMKRRKQLENE